MESATSVALVDEEMWQANKLLNDLQLDRRYATSSAGETPAALCRFTRSPLEIRYCVFHCA